jgi:hypothetical protein
MTAGEVQVIAMSNHSAEKRLKLLVMPQLFHRRLPSRLMQFQDATPAVVSRRDEQEIPRRPDRCADRQTVSCGVIMPPEQGAGVRAEANHL